MADDAQASQRALKSRHGGCQYPGWSASSTNAATLTHENSELVFRNAHGVLLERCSARVEGRYRGNVVELSRQHEAMGLSIDGRTAAGWWDGEPLDYEHILFVPCGDVLRLTGRDARMPDARRGEYAPAARQGGGMMARPRHVPGTRTMAFNRQLAEE